MKIGIMGTRGIPNQYGGFEQFTQTLSQGLLMRGHEVIVYSSSSHPYQENNWNGVQLVHCRDHENRIGTIGQFFYDLRCIRDARKRNFDVLFHLGYSSDSCWYWHWPVNTVNIVNMDGLEWKRSKYNWLTRQFLKRAEAWAARKASVLIADSPGIRDHCRLKYGVDPVCIPYPAELFSGSDPAIPGAFGLLPQQYFLLIARMEPENNIEMIIRGWIDSGHPFPLLVIGSTDNKFGSYLRATYRHPGIQFAGPVYDALVLNNLRFYATRYFHGHSVGGTNPSLLEAMGCGCTIAAHDNIFNRAVLGDEADYFSSARAITGILKQAVDPELEKMRRLQNTEKIRSVYHPEKIIGAYEELVLRCQQAVIAF